jgi:hypothetical protein
MPHVYGVSYFSSKGPTGDGRRKPDLVAPGEKILSCATGELLGRPRRSREHGRSIRRGQRHQHGRAARLGRGRAFLSVRQRVHRRAGGGQACLLSTATDLKRERYFQGAAWWI